MRVDVAARRILVGVRELAYGGEGRPRGPIAALRAELGRRTHERYAVARGEEVALEAELPVSLDREVGGWHITLRGRCDVFVRDGDGGLVEEVKSVVEDVDARGDDALVHARRQARLYALCIDAERRVRVQDVSARVVLVSLVDGSRRGVDAGYRRADTDAELTQLLLALVAVVDARVDRAAARRRAADALRFPYPAPRPHQQEFIDIVADALVAKQPVLAHAPTGIGKTVSALLPALRYALREDATVFYLTAKTTQREHVSSTFEDIANTAPDVALSAVTLRRKEHMCPPGDLRCHPDACPLLARFDERCGDTVAALSAEGALAPERIFERGAAETLCPYELSLELAARADVVIGDFNHVFDSAVPDVLADASRRRVVVIDEAHNLFDRARSYQSPFVSARQLRVVEQSLGIEPLDAELGHVIGRLRVAIDAALQSSDPGARKAMDGCAPQALDVATLSPLADELALLAMRWSQRRWQRQEVTPRDPVLELASALISLSELAQQDQAELVAYVADDEAPRGRGLGIVCVDPSRRLEGIHRRAHGTIAMSATLSPLDYFCDVLGLSRLEPILTSAPSPFASEHREVMVVPSVSTTYRERERCAPEIARIIEQVVAAKAGRYIAYFSSYAFLGVVQSLLTLPKRSVLVQLPSSAPAARTLLLKQLTSSDEPRLLLAVMGGVYGEGIDLPGDALIGAIVVGPGLPPLSFERLAMRHHYDATREAGFAYAMVYPGLQRVIQAAGRVIRGDDDRGVIALIGRRFAEPDYTACLPPHWYRYDPQELVADDPAARLERFWRDQGSGGDDEGNDSLIKVS